MVEHGTKNCTTLCIPRSQIGCKPAYSKPPDMPLQLHQWLRIIVMKRYAGVNKCRDAVVPSMPEGWARLSNEAKY